LGGAKAIATGSWSVANANGFADGERIPLALAIDNLRRIVGATQLSSRERLWRHAGGGR
jgi:2-methylisocitrate lyase-like PEP mutase family enzyme